MPLSVACLLGARANAWHSEVLRFLPEDIAATVVGTTAARYPTDEIVLPFVALPWANEVGSWPRQKLVNLRHRLAATELTLAPGDRLAPFDLIDTCELFTPWTAAALAEKKRRGVPVVVSVWDNIPGHFAGHPSRGPVRARALALADRFLVLTERSAAALRLDGVEAARIFHVRPSVDPDRFRPVAVDAPDRIAARRRLDALPGDVLVLAVARLDPMKGIRHLLDGLALALGQEPRLRLAVAGSGPERPALDGRVQALGIGHRVTFAGESRFAAMPSLHAAADIFVLPSVPTPDWQEQWGQSLLEAMASGKPAVASDTGGVSEVLGDAGIRVAPGDALGIAEALVRLAADADLAADLGKRARARVERSFGHGDQARARADLYRSLAGGSPRA